MRNMPFCKGTALRAIPVFLLAVVSFIQFILIESNASQANAAERYQLVTKWGSKGTGDGQFNEPWGIAVDSHNCQIQKFSPHTSDATLAFDADSYSLGSYALVTLVDADKNTDSSKVQSLLSSVSIQTSPANLINVRMLETGVNTGTFQGSILVGSDDTTEYFQIKATAGDILTVTYDELGLTDTATVTSAPVATPTPTPSPTPTPTTGDTTAPIVTITSPTSSSTYITTSSTITLSGTASDNSGSISSATWSNSKGGDGTASGTTSWSASNIGLSNGDNIITVTAKDNAGNTAKDTITVTYNAATLTPSPTPKATPPPTPSPSPLKEGIVFGFVHDQDEQALEGVSVTIIGTDGGTPLQETETDENGYYEFRGLSQGGYILTYEKEGLHMI